MGFVSRIVVNAKLQLTLDDPPRNPTADQGDPVTVQDLHKTLAAKFTSAWALVRSSPEEGTASLKSGCWR